MESTLKDVCDKVSILTSLMYAVAGRLDVIEERQQRDRAAITLHQVSEFLGASTTPHPNEGDHESSASDDLPILGPRAQVSSDETFAPPNHHPDDPVRLPSPPRHSMPYSMTPGDWRLNETRRLLRLREELNSTHTIAKTARASAIPLHESASRLSTNVNAQATTNDRRSSAAAMRPQTSATQRATSSPHPTATFSLPPTNFRPPTNVVSSSSTIDQDLTTTMTALPLVQLMEFDGTVPWAQYKHHLEFVSNINGWDQRTTLAHFVSRLRGCAQQFSAELEPEILYDLERLKRAFQERFDPGTPQTVFRNQLRTRVQKVGESLADFAVAIHSLARRAYSSHSQEIIEEHAVEQFISGIRDLEVQIATRDRGPTTLNAARSTALNLAENRRIAKMYRRSSGPFDVRVATFEEETNPRTLSSGNADVSTNRSLGRHQ